MNPKRRAQTIDRVRALVEVIGIMAINVAAWGIAWQAGVAAAGLTVLVSSYAYGKRET